MKALIQRVKKASLKVNNKSISTIGRGLLIFIGIYSNDSINDASKICKKIINLRIFNDTKDKINYSILDIKGEILLISQFTLCADTRKGNRPSFKNAMKPKEAMSLFNYLKVELNKFTNLQTGQFGAMMEVDLLNDGPMTIILDTKNENQ